MGEPGGRRAMRCEPCGGLTLREVAGAGTASTTCTASWRSQGRSWRSGSSRPLAAGGRHRHGRRGRRRQRRRAGYRGRV